MLEKKNFQFLLSAVLKSSDIPNHSKKVVLGALAVSILLGVIFWQLTSDKEEYLIQRNFRLLSLWNSEITNKIESYKKIFELSKRQSVREYGAKYKVVAAEQHDSSKWVVVDSSELDSSDYLYDGLSNIFNDIGHDVINCPDEEFFSNNFKILEDNLDEKKYSEFKEIKEKGLGGTFLAQLFWRKLYVAKLENFRLTHDFGEDQDGFQYTWYKDGADLFLQFKFILKGRGTHIDKSPPYKPELFMLTAELNATQDIKKLLDVDAFDDVLIFHDSKYQARINSTQHESYTNQCKNRKVFFQRSSKTYPWKNWCDIEQRIDDKTWLDFFDFRDKNDKSGEESDKNKISEGAQLLKIKAPSGENLIVFKHPVQFSENVESSYIVGVISEKRFQEEYRSISFYVLITILAVLMTIILAVPFFRLSVMHSSEAVTKWNVLGVFFSMVLIIGLLTTIILGALFFDAFKIHLEERMKSTAEMIANQFDYELQTVLAELVVENKAMEDVHDEKIEAETETAAMRNVDDKELRYKELEEYINNKDMRPAEKIVLSQEKIPCKPSNPEANFYDYPNCSMVYWMDKNGEMVISKGARSLSRYLTPVSLASRQYFSVVKNEPHKLWSNGSHSFFLQPITSWGSGKSEVVASMPSKFVLGKDQEISVAALSFQFASLMRDVVLPIGAGFAIVDNNDLNVLIHSNERRSLRENFFVETDQNELIRNLIGAGEVGYVEGQYWGKNTSFYVQPIKNIPWTLVVYRDQAVFDSLVMGTIFFTACLYVVWISIVFLLFITFRRLWPRISNCRERWL